MTPPTIHRLYASTGPVKGLAVLPIVIREGFSRDLADMLLNDLRYVFSILTRNRDTRPTNLKKPAR